MNALLTAIVTWLSINFGLPATYDHPKIEFMSDNAIYEIRYGPNNSGNGTRVFAVYDDLRKRILLPQTWLASSPADVSTLVHEMVHHLQRYGKIKYACAGAREELAYAAQKKWLAQFRTDLGREFGLDDFTLKVTTTCPIP